MWLLYLEANEPDQLIRLRNNQKYTGDVKLWLYNKIFVTEFNLSFGLPRSDTCAMCDTLNNKITAEPEGDEKRQLQQQLEFHQRKGEKGYEDIQVGG